MNNTKLSLLIPGLLITLGTGTTSAVAEPSLAISGALEIEINSGDDHTAASNSGIALATAELGFDAQINESVSGHVLVLHEGEVDGVPLIDEANITISSEVASPDDDGLYTYLSTGRMYIPFGNFESNMISDPLTLELGETQEVALQAGFAAGGLQASLYTFNGEADKNAADNDVVDDFGISIAYNLNAGSMEMDLGFDYINNMAETGTLEGALTGANAPFVEEQTAGMALHAIIKIDGFTVILEHVAASDDFNLADLSFNGAAASPTASNFELAYGFETGGREMTIAVAHQSTSDIDPTLIGLPETRDLLSVSTTIAGDVGLAVELSNSSDYAIADGGTGESGSMLTAQLAIEF